VLKDQRLRAQSKGNDTVTIDERQSIRLPEGLIAAGSWPQVGSVEDAVDQMLPWFRIALPAGEIDRLVSDDVDGELRVPGPLDGPAHRRNWVVGVANGVRQHLGLRMRWGPSEGEKYWHFFARRPNWGGNLTKDALPDFKYADFAKQDWQVVRRALENAGPDRRGTKFLVALPTGYAVGVFSGPFIISEAFTQKLEDEIRAMFTGPDALDPERTVLQLDLPTEMITYAMATPAFRRRFAGWVKRTLMRFVAAAPKGTSIALHLCWGDLHGDYLPAWQSIRAMTQLTNALVEDWPEDRPLLYVILPFGIGQRKPPTWAWRYRWLGQLRLQADTILVAGILHERQTTQRARRALAALQTWYKGRIAVGRHCGFGRCTLEDTLYVCKQGEDLRRPAT
jgi:hypothetical protein